MQDPAPRPLLAGAALLGLLGVASGLPAVAAARPARPAVAFQSEAEEIIRERIGAIGAMGPAEIWREAGRVSALVGDELGADFDAAIDRMLAEGPATARARLFLAAMRIDGDDKPATKVRMGQGWPVAVGNSWSDPIWVVRILENEGVPYKFNFDLAKKEKFPRN